MLLCNGRQPKSFHRRVIGYVPYDEIIGRVLFRFAAGNDEGVGKVD